MTWTFSPNVWTGAELLGILLLGAGLIMVGIAIWMARKEIRGA